MENIEIKKTYCKYCGEETKGTYICKWCYKDFEDEKRHQEDPNV